MLTPGHRPGELCARQLFRHYVTSPPHLLSAPPHPFTDRSKHRGGKAQHVSRAPRRSSPSYPPTLLVSAFSHPRPSRPCSQILALLYLLLEGITGFVQAMVDAGVPLKKLRVCLMIRQEHEKIDEFVLGVGCEILDFSSFPITSL